MRMITATLARLKTADGRFTLGDDVSIGKTYEVDLDSVKSSPALDMNTNTPVLVQTVDCYENGAAAGFMLTELLDFPEGTELPPIAAPSEEWPTELGGDAIERLQEARRPTPTDPLSKMLDELMSVFRSTIGGFGASLVKGEIRVRIVYGHDLRDLEARVNQFLEECKHGYHVSDRTHRWQSSNGLRFAKEIQYHLPPPTPATGVPFLDKKPVSTQAVKAADGRLGTRVTFADETFVDVFDHNDAAPIDDPTENGGAGSGEEDESNA